ncbi:protein NRT1/ PTR FAMILY 2.7-like isoform X1 [Dioscorea cayenensis subsp. rotundata]|uniref:Protein NRT1/ PTR FAMILY 2.7-like isoform X1 n=1 Tax=Dioscorea cayennensis subsp. rotundata TaxID=55577 RepID=A0AB40C0S5_DIOCR|nr:protein NRT1/ PTR FAMILY 2.7-like isoform X1 [Dioscorea cayenensis subsp. rotundata]
MDNDQLLAPPSPPPPHRRRLGGWITFPFIIGAMMGTGIATGGMASNLTVYLIDVFNMGKLNAAQLSSFVNGCLNIAPLLMAIVSDSCFGSFLVISTSIISSSLGMLLFFLTATVSLLRASQCSSIGPCESPTSLQLVVLYTAITLWIIGVGGTRLNPATMGANQFDNADDQSTFFNWYLFSLNVAALVGTVGIVYVDDNVGWGWGFGVSEALIVASLVLFISGRSLYRRQKQPQGSPFSALWHAMLLSMKMKKKMAKLDEGDNDFCYHSTIDVAAQRLQDEIIDDLPSSSSSIQSTNQHHLQDLKTAAKILPIFFSSVPAGTSVSMQATLTILQALVMDCHIGHSFQIPPASMLVFNLSSTALFICIFDRVIFPLWRRLTNHTPTPLQRIGLGYILCTIAIALSAQVEHTRLDTLSNKPMSALWLVPPLMLMGLGDALHYPGSMTLYYQEFPASMRSVATGIVSLCSGLGFYLSTAVIGVIRKFTDWLKDDINQSRVDKVYWMIAMIGVLNFGYFLFCVRMFKKGTSVA